MRGGLYGSLLLSATLLSLGGCGPATPTDEQSSTTTVSSRESSFTERVTMPQSMFAVAKAPEDSFRAREIPSELRERTMVLLTELNARESSDQSIVIDLPADVLFDFDKADLRPDAMPALNKAAELLASYPSAPLAIYGHTDSKGEDSYNDPLSLRRAQAVATWLKAKNSRAAEVQGYGERRPVADNSKPDGSDDPAGRQKNRRVEIVIKPIGQGGSQGTGAATRETSFGPAR